MARVFMALKNSSWCEPYLINTAQHRDLLDNMLDLFKLKVDFDLNTMTANQTLSDLTSTLCLELDSLFKKHPFDIVLAAGDTTTVFVSALVSFYNKIDFGHIEAGLRTFNRYQPFPEEINRVLSAPLADLHFVPTSTEKGHLLRENIAIDKIYVTGNPVIDTLYWVLKNKPESSSVYPYKQLGKYILVTMHRRESLGEKLNHVCHAILNLAQTFHDIHFVLPVHPNPKVKSTLFHILAHHERVHLIEPMKYDAFIHLMQNSFFIMSDSGGVQEEAPALNKPLLVLRDETERPAVLDAEVAKLIGTDTDRIIEEASKLITNPTEYQSMIKNISPYGDGYSSNRIVDALEKHWKKTD